MINLFVTSHPTMHPVLVLSYEMFRVYSEALNTISSFEVLLCDEGHRLKNAMGTKTTLAFCNSIAMRRIVLTGTPIQNNLNELFAVVQVTIPHYLGTLQSFQRTFAQPIAKGSVFNASKIDKQKVISH
jgi:SNF2 family DNA or RNA helicase